MGRYISLILLPLLLLSSIAVAFAEESTPLTIEESVVLRLFDTADGTSASQVEKASKLIEERLNKAYPGKELEVKKFKNGYAIFWRDTLIINVSKEQAQKHNSEPEDLANLWLNNLLTVIGRENLSVSQKSIKIPVNELSYIITSGTGEYKLTCNKLELLAVTIDNPNSKIMFTPKRTGDYSLLIKRGIERVIVTIAVRERAGKISQEIDQEVTGTPTSPDCISSAIAMRIWDGVELKPGANMTILELPTIKKSLKLGEHMKAPVKILLDGADYCKTEGTLTINIINKPIAWEKPEWLWISNRPERVAEDGILFNETLKLDQSIRLLYSHKNVSTQRRKLQLLIKNNSIKPAKLLLRKAVAGPDKYELYAGHIAAMRYMDLYRTESGYILEIAPKSDAAVEDTFIPQDALLSGFCDLQLVEGDPLQISVKSWSTKQEPTQLPTINEPFDPFKIHPHGVFQSPTLTIKENMKLDNSSNSVKEIDIGRWPWMIDPITAQPNTGNYGVIYNIVMELKNNSNKVKNINVSFMPLNGVAQSSLILNSELLEVKPTAKDSTTKIKTFSLEPGQTQKVEISTIPEASSSYPVKFIFQECETI